MSSVPPRAIPAGPTRRTVLITGTALGILAGLGAPWMALAQPAAPASPPTTLDERPHRTLLGVL